MKTWQRVSERCADILFVKETNSFSPHLPCSFSCLSNNIFSGSFFFELGKEKKSQKNADSIWWMCPAVSFCSSVCRMIVHWKFYAIGELIETFRWAQRNKWECCGQYFSFNRKLCIPKVTLPPFNEHFFFWFLSLQPKLMQSNSSK